MTPDAMFKEYRLLSPDTPDYSHCLFSEASEDIIKESFNRASIPYEVFSCYGEELPVKGDVECVTNAKGEALALIKITSVKMVPYGEEKGRLFFSSYLDKEGYIVEIEFKKIFS